MDTRFSIAVHLLILISESETPLSSSKMAESVGTNASFVRKVLGALKQAGIIDSSQGKTGFTLKKPANKITLLDIYHALYSGDSVQIFEIHKNPNDACIVGRFIQPTLENTFSKVQATTEDSMSKTTLANCINDMRMRAEQ